MKLRKLLERVWRAIFAVKEPVIAPTPPPRVWIDPFDTPKDLD